MVVIFSWKISIFQNFEDGSRCQFDSYDHEIRSGDRTVPSELKFGWVGQSDLRRRSFSYGCDFFLENIYF